MDKLIDFNHLLVSSKAYIRIFIEDVNQIVGDPLYPKATQILANIFKSLADKALLRLDESLKEYNDLIEKYSDEKKAVELKLQPALYDLRTETEGIFDYFKYLAELLRYIKSAYIESTPQGLLYPFQKLINFISPRAYIFLRKQWKHNYKYGEFTKQTLNPEVIPGSLEDYAKNEVKFSLCMVSYPSLCDDNYLYNCNIAHEVGHYLDELKPFITSRHDFEDKIGLVNEIDRHPLKEDIAEVGYKWLTEFIADIYATIILGPAYLFSFLEYNEVKSEKTLDDAVLSGPLLYPSNRMRLYFIINALEYKDINLIDSFAKYKDQDTWVNIIYEKLQLVKLQIANEMFPSKETLKTEYLYNDNQAVVYLAAWKTNKDIAKNYFDYIYSVFENVFSNEEHKCETVKNNDLFNVELIKSVHKKLQNATPINEVVDKATYHTKPLSSYLILNFGWMRLLELLENFKDNEDKLSKEVATTKTLIQRSIEASYLHQQFKEQRDRIRDL